MGGALGCAAAPAPTPTTAEAAAAPLSEASTRAHGADSVAYDVTLRADWTLLERICFDGRPRVRVMPEVRAALPFLVDAIDAHTGRALPVDENGVDVRALGTGCVSITIDLRAAARALDDDDLLRVSGDVITGSPDAWLWRPEPWPDALVGTLSVKTPPDIEASLPFLRSDDGATLRVPRATWRLLSKSAFGRLSARTFERAGARFSVARLGKMQLAPDDVEAWLSAAAEAVGTVAGTFPARDVQVLLAPVPSAQAVPFGMVARGGGPSAVLLVSPRAPRKELVGEWVAVHELSHLLLPPLVPEGAWLAEGLASYYQEVLRARAGLRTEAQAWASLAGGFQRGRAQAGGTPLEDACGSMRSTFSFQHVYWGGAAVLLSLDVALRARGSSLDEAVARARRLEPHDVAPRSTAHVLSLMSDPAVGLDLHAFVAAAVRQPFIDTDALLAQLGVRVDGSAVQLDDGAPLAGARRAIVSARPPLARAD